MRCDLFTTIQQTVDKNGIQLEDIYNFDERGFAISLISTSKLVTRAEYYCRRSILQPGNREWVTAIETINSESDLPLPCIIFKGKNCIESWFDSLPQDRRFEVSDNGWTTDEIGLHRLQKLLILCINSRVRGKYRLLILDGHRSHLTPRFDRICAEHAIIPFVCLSIHRIFYNRLIFGVLRR